MWQFLGGVYEEFLSQKIMSKVAKCGYKVFMLQGFVTWKLQGNDDFWKEKW